MNAKGKSNHKQHEIFRIFQRSPTDDFYVTVVASSPL